MSSQYEEDQIIADFFGEHVGTFLDLGAGDGQLCSNTLALVERGWNGCCIEPQAESFSALRKLHKSNRERIRLIQAAVTGDGRLLTFYHHDSQLSTGNPDLAISDEDCYLVPSLSPNLIATLGPRWDFVSLDCEGLDQEIAIRGKPMLRATTLFCYEHDLPRQGPNAEYSANWNRILREIGFTKIVGKTEGNTLVTRP